MSILAMVEQLTATAPTVETTAPTVFTFEDLLKKCDEGSPALEFVAHLNGRYDFIAQSKQGEVKDVIKCARNMKPELWAGAELSGFDFAPLLKALHIHTDKKGESLFIANKVHEKIADIVENIGHSLTTGKSGSLINYSHAVISELLNAGSLSVTDMKRAVKRAGFGEGTAGAQVPQVRAALRILGLGVNIKYHNDDITKLTDEGKRLFALVIN